MATDRTKITPSDTAGNLIILIYSTPYIRRCVLIYYRNVYGIFLNRFISNLYYITPLMVKLRETT